MAPLTGLVMHRSVIRTLALVLLATPAVARAQVTTPPTVALTPAVAPPEVGQLAPDFTADLVDAAAGTSSPVTLSKLRGKVVVLAFYPKDRTSGCTAELTRFRDEHARLFGADVMVLPASADSVASHVSWGQEMKFPFSLISDPSLALAEAYGSRTPGRAYSNRTVFVIGRDGRVAYRELRFNALNEDAYTQLAAAVAKAR